MKKHLLNYSNLILKKSCIIILLVLILILLKDDWAFIHSDQMSTGSQVSKFHCIDDDIATTVELRSFSCMGSFSV